MNKQVITATLLGAVLGIFCIVGASVRMEGLSATYLFSFWLNRVAMGVLIGYLPKLNNSYYLLVRGIIVGLFISLLFYSSTNFLDLTGFLAGGVYGVIIDVVTNKKRT